jgi:hypothetical protein
MPVTGCRAAPPPGRLRLGPDLGPGGEQASPASPRCASILSIASVQEVGSQWAWILKAAGAAVLAAGWMDQDL